MGSLFAFLYMRGLGTSVDTSCRRLLIIFTASALWFACFKGFPSPLSVRWGH